MEMSFYGEARNEGHAGEKWMRIGDCAAMARQARSEGAGQHTGGRDMHACNQPLGDGKQPARLWGGKSGHVKAQHVAIAHCCFGTLDGERGADGRNRSVRRGETTYRPMEMAVSKLAHSGKRAEPVTWSIKGSQLSSTVTSDKDVKAASGGWWNHRGWR